MRSLLPIALFVLIYMVGFATLAILRGNQEFVFYTVTMVVMIGAILVIHHRVRFSMALLWMLSVWGILHLGGGLVPVGDSVLYNLWLVDLGFLAIRYDHAVHAYGFGTATWACWQAVAAGLSSGGRSRRISVGIAFAIVCMGTGLGALNEVIEFAATKLVPDTNVGGYENTAWDLVSNLVGSSVAAAILWLYSRGAGGADDAGGIE